MAAENKPFRLPLVADPQNRDTTSLRDAKLINGYIEKQGESEVWVYKRPGFQSTTGGSASPGTGRGVSNWQGNLYSVVGTSLYKNGTAVGSGITGTGMCSFDSTMGGTPTFFVNDGTVGGYYTYNTTAGFATVAAGSDQTYLCDPTLGTVDVYTASTVGLAAGYPISGVGIPAGTTITSITDANYFTISNLATASGYANMVVTLPGPPAISVKGTTYIDGTMYLMTPGAVLRGSAFNDLTNWDPINSILAQAEPDPGVALAKQLVYAVAFNQWTTEVFYDAGNSPGSPLSPVQGALIPIGCRHANTVRELGGSLFWVGQTRNGSVSVMQMDGLKAQTVSTPAVERLLQAATWTSGNVYSWSAMFNGHKFYAVTLTAANLTLVFDTQSRSWSQWQDVNGNYLPFVDSTFGTSGQAVFQHETNGGLYAMSATVTLDGSDWITLDLYTPNFAGETKVRKVVKTMGIVADQTSGSTLQVRVSDDDYQTWSNFRVFDLGQIRPRLINCGTFRRRAFHFRHSSPVPLRIKAVELQVELGTL